MANEVSGGALPVDVELASGRVQEGEPGTVGRPLDAVEDLPHDRTDLVLRRAARLGSSHRVQRASKVVGALGLVEVQRARQRLQHAVGDAGGVAALQALVVVHADAGQGGDLLATQALDPPRPVGR